MLMKPETTVLTLDSVARQPKLITTTLSLSGELFTCRPLIPEDVLLVAAFLKRLSPETRKFSNFDSYDVVAATNICDAINRYDKLRLVVTSASKVKKRILALLEYSFDKTEADKVRFENYGISLDEHDCRFGLCLADDYQNQSLGTALFGHVAEVARRFGQKRIILWGGVFKSNQRAIRYYEKNGFKMMGEFENSDGNICYDMMLELT